MYEKKKFGDSDFLIILIKSKNYNEKEMYGESMCSKKERKNICKCNNCGGRFEYKERVMIKGYRIAPVVASPCCEASFRIVHFKNTPDELYLNKFQTGS